MRRLNGYCRRLGAVFAGTTFSCANGYVSLTGADADCIPWVVAFLIVVTGLGLLSWLVGKVFAAA